MIRPSLPTRMKQRNNRVCLAVERAKVAAFVAIAFRTGKAEIVALAVSAMFFSDDVVNFVSEQSICLIHATIFTTLICPIGDFAA